MAIVHKIGRRKTSVARVYLQEGNGEIFINGRELANYFPTAVLQYKVEQAFLITDTKEKYNVDIKVFGGGNTGQELLEFNIEGITSKGFSVETPLLITNSDDYLDIIISQDKEVNYNQNLITIVV